MISKEDVQKLAALARIKLTSKEEEKFAKEIDKIIGYVDQIRQFKGISGGKVSGKVTNVLREDAHPHESGIHTEAILNDAPKRTEDYIQVKKILS